MNQTRTQRIHRGFHRIGTVLAGMILALGLIVVGVVTVEETDRSATQRFDISNARPPTIDVRLPNGAIVKNVPQGTTKHQLKEALDAQGYDLNVLRPPGSVAVLDYETFRFNWGQRASESAQGKQERSKAAPIKGLPPGFTLDEPDSTELPPGFVLDAAPAPEPETFGQQVLGGAASTADIIAQSVPGDDLAAPAMASTDKPKWADDSIAEKPGAGSGYFAAVIASIPLWLLAGFAAAAAAIYVMCRGVGWIIAGFAGD